MTVSSDKPTCRTCAGTGIVVMDRRATHGYHRPEACPDCAQPVTITTSPPGRYVAPLLVDERCLALAEHFLRGGAASLGEPQGNVPNRLSLARHIQQAVDDWFAVESAKLDVHVPDVDRG